MKKAIIIGATSGIGQEVARILVQQGWRIGIAGRREDVLLHMQQAVPGQIEIQCLDVTKNDAALRLNELIDRLGGMDLFLLSSGVGFQNRSLEPEIELNTARTNVEGFIRMVTAAFHHFKKTGGGHIAVISSIAGTKGIGSSPCLFCHQAISEHLHRRIGATVPDAKAQYPFHRHPPGICGNRSAAKRQVPNADACRQSGAMHRPVIGTEKKRTVIIDRRYRLLVFFWRMIPRWLWERLPIKN